MGGSYYSPALTQLGGDSLGDAVESIPRIVVTSPSYDPGNGYVVTTFVTPVTSQAVTQILYVTGTQAAVGSTLVRFGLYSVASNGDLTLVARTANDTTLLAATGTQYAKAFDTTGGYPASYVMYAGTRYAIAMTKVGGTTVPFLHRIAGSMPAAVNGRAPLLQSYSGGGSATDLPTTIAAGDQTADTSVTYCAALA